MAQSKTPKMRTITGTIRAAEYDEEDEILAISLFGDDDEEYSIELDEEGEGLLDYVDARVALTGTVQGGDDGFVITVKRFEELDDDLDDDDDDLDDDLDEGDDEHEEE